MTSYTGEFRLCLERVYIDEGGDRAWETVVEVTDHPQALVSGWLPAVGARLGATQESPAAPSDSAPQTGAEDKPKRTRRTKAEIDAERAAQQPVAAPAPTAVPSESAPQPTPIAAPAATSTEAPPARYNPFT